MGTPHASNKRTESVPVRFTPEGLAKIDEVKGTWTRSEYIRQAVALAVKQGKAGPEPVQEQDEPRW